MSLPTSRFAYLDCIEYFDRASEDPQGIRIRQLSHDAAVHLRSRLHQARKLLREDSRTIYELGDPKHGVSAYDTIVCRIRNHEGVFYLYLEQIITSTEIEPLSELDDFIALAPPEPVRLLEDLNASNRNEGLDGRDAPSALAQGLGTGDRDRSEDRSEERVSGPPLRSQEVKRRV